MTLEKPTLLIVDDEQMNRDALSRRLAKHNYNVALAASGAEALAMIRNQPFDLVLLDVMMPEMDGLEVLTSIRETHSLTEMPVIMVTARDQNADVVAALQMGANDFVTKPVNFPLILARIQTQLQMKTRPAAGPVDTVSMPSAATHTVAEPTAQAAAAPFAAAPAKPASAVVAARRAPQIAEQSMSQTAVATDRRQVAAPVASGDVAMRIPGYEIVGELGHGAMGTVYKARHGVTNRTVALKVLRAENTRPDSIRRFFKEVQALGQLSHPNVVMVYDAGNIDDLFYFAMEYLEGIDLSKLVKHRGPLPVQVAREMIRQAALGLQHLYQNDLVHRDIKPSNLFVTWQTETNPPPGGKSKSGLTSPQKSNPGGGSVKIVDLGLALLNGPPDIDKNSQCQTRLGQVVGTVAYMAPEQWLNAHSVDIRADIYSLGCSLYYLLTGQVPYKGDTPMELMIKHSQDSPLEISQFRLDVPKRLVSTINRMMAKRPSDRFQTPFKVAEALS